MKLFFRKYILGFIVWFIYKTLSLTWRVSIYEPSELLENLKNKKPVIFSHWHGDEVVLISLISRYKIATMTSTSDDGQMMNTVIHLLGGVTSRGSSTRGGVSALKGLIRLVRTGRNVSFAVDGPKGPLYKAKPGVFEFSRLTKAPIYAAGVACDRAWVFHKAWNKAYLPKPFAKILIHWSEKALPAISQEQDPRSEALAKTLEDALHNSRQIALKNFAT